MVLKPKSLLDEYPGGILGYDLQFVAGAKAARTVIFEIGDDPTAKESFSVYIDVADDKKTVAISFVHHKSALISYSECEPDQAFGVAEELFGFAQQLLQINRIVDVVRDTLRAQARRERRNRIRETATRLAALERLERDRGPVFATG